MHMAFNEPELIADLMEIIASWNLARMQVVLEEGVDLWVCRGWHENASF